MRRAFIGLVAVVDKLLEVVVDMLFLLMGMLPAVADMRLVVVDKLVHLVQRMAEEDMLVRHDQRRMVEEDRHPVAAGKRLVVHLVLLRMAVVDKRLAVRRLVVRLVAHTKLVHPIVVA